MENHANYCITISCLHMLLPYLAAALAGFFLDFPTPVFERDIPLLGDLFCIVVVSFHVCTQTAHNHCCIPDFGDMSGYPRKTPGSC